MQYAFSGANDTSGQMPPMSPTTQKEIDVQAEHRNYVSSLQQVAQLAREDLCNGAEYHQKVVTKV